MIKSPSPTCARLLSGLKGAKPSGSGWTAKCPAHDDRRQSLSLREGDDGRALLTCHAGCNLSAIIAPLGLSERDLFPAREEGSGQAHGRIVATYDYTDESGALLFQVIRFEPKDFRQRRPNAQGGWVWNLGNVRRVLYRLPKILAAAKAAEVVYVVEGEKDVQKLEGLGLVATTSPQGAGKWRPEYGEALRGIKGAVVLPDNDEPGRQHARQVARSVYAAGPPVKILELPGLLPKEDVADWIASGGTKEKLLELVKSTPRWEPQAEPEPEAGLQLTPLSQLLSEPEESVSWVVGRRLPAGGLSLMVAKPKVGKSTTARHLALCVSRGESWLGFATQQGPVFYLALEDKRAEVRKHFRDMGATSSDPVHVFIAPSPQDGLEQLRQATVRLRPVLVIVDPLLRMVRVRDANDYAVMTAAMEPLLVLARQSGAHVMATHHAGKGDRSGGDSILGSTAIFGAVDTAVILKRSERFRTLSTIQRYGEDLEELTLLLDAETRRVSAGLTRREADEADAGNAIIEALRAAGAPMTESEIGEAVEGRTATKRKTLRALLAAESLQRIGRGGKGDPFRYSLPDACSHVPTISREQANKDPQTTPNPSRSGTKGCSLPSLPEMASDEPREQPFETADAWEDSVKGDLS